MKGTIILSNFLFQYKLDGLKNGIKYGWQISEIIARHLSLRPFHLNVIEAACHGRLKETGHSLVLADMLRHPAIQYSFIETFLGLEHEFMVVTAEIDRVDVALRGKDIFIIVENKVNAAEEQKNQVYRYVHEIGMEKYGYPLSQIYVVYLNPTNRDLPSEYSLCDNNNEHNVFEELGDGHYTVQSYKYDITNWLRRLVISDEPHIDSALDQYIDYLENKFHTSPLDKNMNSEIKKILLKELKIENKPLPEQITALVNQYDKTEELLQAIYDLKKELFLNLIKEWREKFKQKLGEKLIVDTKPDEGFYINIYGIKCGCWYNEKENEPYWGFMFENAQDKQKEIVRKILDRVYVSNQKSNYYWIAYAYDLHADEQFERFYEEAEKLHLI